MLEAAAPLIEAGERAKLQPAMDRVARLAGAAQAKAVAVAVAAERERCAQLADTHGAVYTALAPIGPGETITIGGGAGYQQVPFAPLLRDTEQPPGGVS